MRVTRVRIHPVKSTQGSDVDDAVVEPWGLRHDRRWMVIARTGRYAGGKLRAQRNPLLLRITARPMPDGGLTLRAPGAGELRVAVPVGRPTIPVRVSRLPELTSCDASADAWLSEVLGEEVRLGWLDDPRRRPVAGQRGGRPGDPLSLADTGPLLLTSQSSLRQLDDWVAETARERTEPAPEALSMDRFRPNVVVEGPLEPFAEESWSRVTIGGVGFRVSEICDRCVVTTIDPRTLARGPEPIRTLARHRRRDGKTWFGVRLIPTGSGTLRVGDPVSAG